MKGRQPAPSLKTLHAGSERPARIRLFSPWWWWGRGWGGGVYSAALRPASGPSGQTDRNWLRRLSFQSRRGCCDSACQSPRTGISTGPLKMRSGSLVSFKTRFVSAQRGGGISISFGEYVLHTSKHAFSLFSCAATFCFLWLISQLAPQCESL